MINACAFEQLSNPVWYALQTVHRPLALGTDTLLRYPGQILQLLGCECPDKAGLNDLMPWMTTGEKIYIVGELPSLPPNWSVSARIECLQMVYPDPSLPQLAAQEEIIQLGEADEEEMLDLVRLVQPGFFYARTYLLGRYFGIRRQGRLVAMAGERLKITGLTEISAVNTHPDFTGQGLGRQLITQVARININEENIPFLHVRSTNDRAIGLYELLGFKELRRIFFNELTCC